LASLNTYGAAGLLGREVQVTGGHVALGEERPVSLRYRIEGDATRVGIRVMNDTGATVRLIEAREQTAGARAVSWDGRDESGRLVPDGAYTYTVSALDTAGVPVPTTTFSVGRVTGVNTDNGQVSLTVNGERVPASAVLAIGL
jgi:flagellar basal-body rod modification protein FlgD